MDKLKQLESFVSVVARGSLTAAAKSEGVAPAIMGRRLDALEERLGVKLLVRTTRRIALTHEGSAFLEDCQRLLRTWPMPRPACRPAASRPAAICASPHRPASGGATSRRW
jgi:DNA-binding transcriptional LysR family regulator